jgi:hypothetical protein
MMRFSTDPRRESSRHMLRVSSFGAASCKATIARSTASSPISSARCCSHPSTATRASQLRLGRTSSLRGATAPGRSQAQRRVKAATPAMGEHPYSRPLRNCGSRLQARRWGCPNRGTPNRCTDRCRCRPARSCRGPMIDSCDCRVDARPQTRNNPLSLQRGSIVSQCSEPNMDGPHSLALARYRCERGHLGGTSKGRSSAAQARLAETVNEAKWAGSFKEQLRSPMESELAVHLQLSQSPARGCTSTAGESTPNPASAGGQCETPRRSSLSVGLRRTFQRRPIVLRRDDQP